MSDAVTTPPEDDRLIRETGIDARIAAIVLPAARAAGFQLVRVRLSAQNGLTLQIMAERPDGTMTVKDCEDLSRVVSPALDVEDPIEKAYNLEVSSPGIDRPLVRRSDFEVAKGHIAKIETAFLVGDRKRFRGRIADVTGTSVMIERDQASYGDEPTVEIPLDALSEARLVLTDELIRESLARDKQARRMAERDDDAPEAETEDDN